MKLRLNPYLVFNGNASEAVEFYRKVFDAELAGTMRFGDLPPNPEFPLPEEAKNRVMHALLKVGESELMFSDTFPGQPHQPGNQVTIAVHTDDPSRTRKIFEALAEGGSVEMPLQETTWSPLYGIVTDKFGVTFQINTVK